MKIDSTDLSALLYLNKAFSSKISILRCLQEGHTPSALWGMILHDNFLGRQEQARECSAQFDPLSELKKCKELNIHVVTLFEEDYPSSLKEMIDPPLILYVKGKLQSTDRNAIAIVGSRQPNFYGREQATKLARELSEAGLTVVSGMARGIDQESHRAALQIPYGRTLAVMGCGLDVGYPRGSESLKQSIEARGALISEYSLGTPPRAENFPKRNRIIAGLSLGVLVVQAHSRSGSLITAHAACEQGKEVFAIPGPVNQMGSRGTHSLIKEGACLVETSEDILLAMSPILSRENPEFSQVSTAPDPPSVESPQNSPTPVTSEKGQLILGLLQEKPLHYDEILNRSDLEQDQLPSLLMKLELSRQITKISDGRFALREGVSYA